ncbi:potassium-transporting ATPase [Mycobacterium sp. 4D054]
MLTIVISVVTYVALTVAIFAVLGAVQKWMEEL